MENKKQVQGNDLSIILIFLLCVITYKVSPFALYYWERLKWYGLAGLITGAFLILASFIYQCIRERKLEESKTFFIGFSRKKPIFISDSQRTTHAQVLGTTGSGKTESVILPWIVQDIKNGNGALIIDGKSDSNFLERLYSYTVKFDREKDFKLFSLANLKNSHSFNPLKGASSVEVSEKIFSSFNFESEYYKNIQYKIFLNLVSLIREKETPTFKQLHLLLTNIDKLSSAVGKCENDRTRLALKAFIALPEKEREERISGLEAQLSYFVQNECHILFDEEKEGICINDALEKGQILYFQLPTMLYPFLGEVTGKLILQSLQSAISRRHLSQGENKLFSVYLDDFQDYIYSGFGSLLNKSRSANIAMVFSHQSLGDLEKISPSFSDVVLTNTNLKFILRINDPKTCDYFAKSFGTVSSHKTTDQIDEGVFGKSRTGKGTLRKVEEYIFHPNTFKKISIGRGMVSLPDAQEVKHFELSFPRLRDIKKEELPIIQEISSKINSEKIKNNKGRDESIIYETSCDGGENERI